ncbi:MAG TPA: START domain-containing protein [Puia sp.]|nr:START domain-containing protein [Puia sp.]
MQRKNHLLFTICCTLQLFSLRAQQEWTLKKEENGIKVYSKSSEHSKYNELRVEMTLQASLSSVAALVLDIGNYPNWSFNTKQTSILRTVSASELYFYSEIHSPWPASNRDLAIHLAVAQDPNNKVMTIHAEELPNYIPVKDGLVRVPMSDEIWTVTPAGNGSIKIDYRITLDPGAGTPAWLINMFSVKGPFETFSHVREQLKIAKYSNAKLSFIKD